MRCTPQTGASRGGWLFASSPQSLHPASCIGTQISESVQELLTQLLGVDRAVNFRLREDVLVQKCTGRRVCGECGKGFNVAVIDYPAADGQGAIFMPPLDPPAGCVAKMETRADDSEAVVRARLAVYKQLCGPVEDFYAQRVRPRSLVSCCRGRAGAALVASPGGAQRVRGRALWQDILTYFEITAGIPETMPRLLTEVIRLLRLQQGREWSGARP